MQGVLREIPSIFTYPDIYRAETVDEHVRMLRTAFPGRGLFSFDQERVKAPLLPGAEAKFAMPPWWRIADTYNEAVERLLQKLRANYDLDQEDDADALRQHPRSVEMWGRLRKQQGDKDIYILDAQFGMRWRGISALDVRESCAGSNEYPLGAYGGLMMMLTNSTRLIDGMSLSCDFAGDDYARKEGFLCAPACRIRNERLEFETVDPIHLPGRDTGSLTAFLPQ